MKVTNSYWFGGAPQIGIVVGKDEITGNKKAYIGICTGMDQKLDELIIAKTGSPVVPFMLQEILNDLKE